MNILIIFFVIFCISTIFGERIPARKVGVKCDGKSDDTQALNAAIRGLAEGDILDLPEKGICSTTGNIEIIGRKNISINSEGPGARIVARKASKSAIIIKNSNGIRISDFKFNVPYSRTRAWVPEAAGIVIDNSSNIQIQQTTISKTAYIGIFIFKSNDILIQHNSISESFDNGIHIVGSANVRILDNLLLDIKQDGMIVGPDLSDKQGGEKPSKNIEIFRNVINRTEGMGINLDTAQDVQVVENSIFNTFRTGIQLSDWRYTSGDLVNISISRNEIKNSPREKHEYNKWEVGIRVHAGNFTMKHILVEKNLLQDPKAREPKPRITFGMVLKADNTGFMDDLQVIDNVILDETEEIGCMNSFEGLSIGESLIKGNTKNKVDCPAPNESSQD